MPAASRSRRYDPPANQGSLDLRSPPQRLAAARAENERLLRKIELKKRDLTRLGRDVGQIQTAVVGKMRPLHEEVSALDAEIRALFAELLVPGRLGKKAHREVEAVFRELCENILPPPDITADPDPAPELPEGGVSATRPGGGTPPEAIRGIYRRLAGAIHPDKVTDEDEKARRTEIMKQVTTAYGDGDLARLLELERTWAAGAGAGAGASPSPADDVDAMCAALERTNEELRTQLAQLVREVSELRKSPHGHLAKVVSSARKQGDGDGVLAELIEEAEEDVAHLRRIRDHVRSFRDGKLSLDELIQGPLDEPIELFEPGMLEDLLSELASEIEAASKPIRRRRPAKKRRK